MRRYIYSSRFVTFTLAKGQMFHLWITDGFLWLIILNERGGWVDEIKFKKNEYIKVINHLKHLEEIL